MKLKLSPAIRAEREAVINALRQVVPILGAMAGPHLEVVLHDVTRPEGSVVGIANGHITGRVVGSSVLDGPHGDRGFAAATRDQVDAAHALALSLGAVCEGRPGLRPEYHAHYYGAYFRDPDGNKLCVACHAAPL